MGLFCASGAVLKLFDVRSHALVAACAQRCAAAEAATQQSPRKVAPSAQQPHDRTEVYEP